MSNVFLISDTHFGHRNMINFKRDDGTPIRPFKSVEEMDETLVNNWNNVVKPNDKVYHLGDVVINRKSLYILNRLNGSKRLIRGNHDVLKTKEYMEYFKEIYGCRVLSDMILTHIPLFHESIGARFQTNVHGHLHTKYIKNGLYYNVSVEQINYTPIALEDLRVKIKDKKEKYQNNNIFHIEEL